jgi:uncharacterized RDD family membrane protein YckC
MLILGAVGLTAGFFFFDTFVRLGVAGRLIGFFAALLYFSIFDSSLANGQTLGKRLMKIEVINSCGESISVGLAALRFSILGIPYFLNGFYIPIPGAPLIIEYLAEFIVFGLGGILIYLFLFNLPTRQSLHDLMTDTLVVRTYPVATPPKIQIWKAHLVIVSIWCIAVVPLLGYTSKLAQGGTPALLSQISQNIVLSGQASRGEVWMIKNHDFTHNRKSRVLLANVHLRSRPADYKKLANHIASIILIKSPTAYNADTLTVTLSYGYDIGIARTSISWTVSHTPVEWKALMGENTPGAHGVGNNQPSKKNADLISISL